MKYPNHVLLDVSQTSHINLPLSYKRLRMENTMPSPFLFETQTSLIGATTTVPISTTQHQRLNKKIFTCSSTTLPVFDIHFLRKEKLYTKLKYSRCPQYDIVSGGFAAILAGFIGFLISEKFGIELVDSGDFYVAFMYGVFAAFSLRPLLLAYSKHETPYNPLSLKYLFIFLCDLVLLSISYIKILFIKSN